ncbi:helix-turn-helix domain-containing protein [Argonema galeatum]|uniref:helix-turn-helix domain-containing protein n=1 Tax=Argonema galeatum TaxID=2942762 RepID=UPI00201111E3|nr:transcriptional regulator [Argonema galeatum]MCL1463339.1 transcriptional regulator [Argonema galeatum A003/A1]
MTLTFNGDKYSELLVKYQPKLIRTEEENDKALAIVEELMHRYNRTPEENELYELLVTLIEKFEQDFYEPGNASNSHSMLLFLMEQQGVESKDLVKILGDGDVVAEIVEGKRKISQEEAIALGAFFGVDASLFV